MSAFLGPIHYWLYNKIGNQEKLTKAIAIYAASEGWIADADEYIKALPPLETVIDEGNIHGWLQARINDAEGRYASLVSSILKGNADRINALCTIAFEFGKVNAVSAESAIDVYKAFEDFFVNGMPCDRVNTVTENSAAYYTIRKSVMDGMLDGSEWAVEMPDSAHYVIKKQ